MSEYPEHDKLGDKADVVQEFLHRIENRNLVIGKWVTGEYGQEEFIEADLSDQSLIYDFLGVDAKVIEAEKRVMLERMRQLTERDTKENQ